jgi:tRNA(Ile)-lysidine synthase
MLEEMLEYIQQEQLFHPRHDRILLAVSGGIDSVVLSHLFQQAGIQFGIAHCNFNLRGQESQEDEVFVRDLAQRLGVPFYATSFETQRQAQTQRSSIQMTARELRYQWLEEQRVEHHYQYIATAHHINDSIETLVINMTKGCGIRGLHGILPKQGQIIRPILFASKEEVGQYAQAQGLSHREDSSNYSDKYLRNKVRHYIVPQLQSMNPALEDTFEDNFKKWQDAEQLYQFAIDYFRRQICRWKDQQMYIDLMQLRQSPAPRSVLYEILAPYGFNTWQIPQILATAAHAPGALFMSDTHRLLKDRSHFILQKKEESKAGLIYYLNDIQNEEIHTPFGHFRAKVHKAHELVFERNRNLAYFDLDLLQTPLRLRTWRQGDVFQPFGMRGKHRKVSDFFNDFKVSRFDKEECPILESEGKIIWVVGFRSDERFKVTERTQQILELEFLGKP